LFVKERFDGVLQRIGQVFTGSGFSVKKIARNDLDEMGK